MNKQELIAIVEMAWDDICAVGDGSEIGIALVVMRHSNNELETQMASTAPPEVTRYALSEMVASWLREKTVFERLSIKRKRVV
jgi:hypothetical protein